MSRKEDFIRIFKKAEKKYGKSEKRLAGDYAYWGENWKVLIVTIMSAQSRDDTTISIGEELFRKYRSLESLAKARYSDVLKIFKGLNYNKTKARNVIKAAKVLLRDYKGKVPETIDELIEIPGVGRKTANLILTECFGMDGICVDTHVHRISNVLGFVNTKTPDKTEEELKKLVSRSYWSRINRIFVLWGKEVSGRDKNKFLERLEEA